MARRTMFIWIYFVFFVLRFFLGLFFAQSAGDIEYAEVEEQDPCSTSVLFMIEKNLMVRFH